MVQQRPQAGYDPLVSITELDVVSRYGDNALLGNWFVFLKSEWFQMPEVAQIARLLMPAAQVNNVVPPAILFRDKELQALPGIKFTPKELPRPSLVSLTSDKALYRAKRDTIRLLIVAPQQPGATLSLQVQLSGNPYASYPLTLDEFGLNLWSIRDLPEGEYVVTLDGVQAEPCRFEVAEYRLAALNAELAEQQLSGDILHFTLSLTSFNQPYAGPLEVELQERGQRVGKRLTLRSDQSGRCRGSFKLSGAGPYTLNIIAGERTATIALKGSEQQRRETLTISALGEVRELSLLPMAQSNTCRGMYITRGGTNTEPFTVRRVIGSTVEIIPRVNAEALRVVVVDPVKGIVSEFSYSQTIVEQPIQLPVPQPFGVVLLGALIDGEAWEGWCAVLRPSDVQLECNAPTEARPGSRITLTLRTGRSDAVVPVQVLVKDQRLIAPSDPEVELAACVKQNLSVWSEASTTGKVERRLSEMTPPSYILNRMMMAGGQFRPMAMSAPFPVQSAPAGPPPSMPIPAPALYNAPFSGAIPAAAKMSEGAAYGQKAVAAPAQIVLTKMRVQFPEVVYNEIVRVRGEAKVEVMLGESLTRYSIEAFALAPETMDWQRVETSVNVVQPVYGELTVSPFVFPGDPVMGRLDVGAASGAAIVEVRHDGELLPLFLDDGSVVTPGLPIPSNSVVRFPVRPGAITATVRDARSGESDVSERYVTEPGQLRHIARRLQLLKVGDELSLQTLRQQQVLEIRPMPALEQPFQLFIEGAISYPFGCIEQTSCKLLAMFAGYIAYQEDEKRAHEYEEVIPAWFKRLESMYLPSGGFCFYPPQDGGSRKPDTHYGPLGVKYLLQLPAPELSGVKQPALLAMLGDIRKMAESAARYYKIADAPRDVQNCRDAYQVMTRPQTSPREKSQALAFARSRLLERNGQTSVQVGGNQPTAQLFGEAVGQRVETAYAAATLLIGKEPGDLNRAIAATNFLTGQINEAGRLYSTADTAACLALLLALRDAGIVASGADGRVALNGQEMTLPEAFASTATVETLRCLNGVIAAQLTSEVIENWSTYKGKLSVEVRLEKRGKIQERFTVGDELELVIRVPRYEPGLLAHVCLPDALARIVGGGQVKRFSLDFSEKSELRVPLAVLSATSLPVIQDAEKRAEVVRWLGGAQARGQRWAVIVRNMFKEEQIGNPGLLTVQTE